MSYFLAMLFVVQISMSDIMFWSNPISVKVVHIDIIVCEYHNRRLFSSLYKTYSKVLNELSSAFCNYNCPSSCGETSLYSADF